MRALLSIKPEHARNIFDGNKKYEFRKKIFSRFKIDSIVVYATKPIGKIVGEFEVIDIVSGSPTYVWEVSQHSAGISKSYFDEYFAGSPKAHAIRIGAVKLYKNPLDPFDLIPHFTPPQSYMYIYDHNMPTAKSSQLDFFVSP